MLNVGDKVLFISGGVDIPTYYSEDGGIPAEMIIHGYCVQKDPKNGGIVEGFYEDYVIVSFIDDRGNKTQLGFREHSLVKVEIDGFYETY